MPTARMCIRAVFYIQHTQNFMSREGSVHQGSAGGTGAQGRGGTEAQTLARGAQHHVSLSSSRRPHAGSEARLCRGAGDAALHVRARRRACAGVQCAACVGAGGARAAPRSRRRKRICSSSQPSRGIFRCMCQRVTRHADGGSTCAARRQARAGGAADGRHGPRTLHTCACTRLREQGRDKTVALLARLIRLPVAGTP